MAQGGWRLLAIFSSKIFEQALEGDLDLEVLEVTQPSSRSSILRRITLLCVVSHPWPTFHFLQKRLGKGQKFFDSGDYQMAKQVNFQWFWWSRVHLFLLSVKQSVPLREVQVAWGQGCLSWPNPLAQVSLPEKSKKSPFIRTGVAHPTPDTVPARKSSIIQVLSKDMKNYFERIFYYFSCRG